MQSHFSSQTIAEVFRDLYLGERTGALSLVRGETEKRVYFDRGLIHYAESTEEAEDLGRKLIAEGRLSAGALEEAQRSISSSPELARALVYRELISKQTLNEAVEEVLFGVVESVFRWDGGSARFSETDPLPDLLESDVLRTFQVIFRGVMSISDFDAIRDALLALGNRLRMREPTPLPVERLALSPTHGYILSRIDGTTATRGVLSLLPQSEESEALKFLFGLLIMGVLELDPPLSDGPFRVADILRDHADTVALERLQEQTILQADKQMRAQNPYEILGVTPSASPQAIERAYAEAKALFSRERILPRVRDRFKSELAVIESRLIESYLTLNQPERRRVPAAVAKEAGGDPGDENYSASDLLVRVEMDKTKSKLEQEEASRVAEGYYRKALKAKREGDFHNAIQYGKLAISYHQGDARYFHTLAECQVRNPGARWQHMAEQNLTTATELDPWNAQYRVSLGRFYKRRGLKLRARKQFEEALKIVPGHEDATAEIENLG